MPRNEQSSDVAGTYTTKQQLFVRYFTAVLVDLTVLNLFDEYWDFVTINSFTISILAAILLQVLLKITLKIEHRLGEYFNQKPGKSATVKRLLSAWAVLFGSKLIILEAINFSFGDRILFSGPIDGLVAFIIVVVAILAAELLVYKFNKSLGYE